MKTKKQKATDKAEEVYLHECNHGRYVTAMAKAIAAYKQAMKPDVRMVAQDRDEWWKD